METSQNKRWYKDKTKVCSITRQGIYENVSFNIAIQVYTNGKRFYAIGKSEYANGQVRVTQNHNGRPSANTFELLLKALRKDARQAVSDEVAWNFDKKDARSVFRLWNDIIDDFT